MRAPGWPAGAHPGTTVQTPVSLEEAAATLVAAGGGALDELEAPPLPTPGQSVDPDRVQYFEHIYKGFDRVGVLRGDHKRVRTLPTLGIDNRARKGQVGATKLWRQLGNWYSIQGNITICQPGLL